jgi:O-antigen ligase
VAKLDVLITLVLIIIIIISIFFPKNRIFFLILFLSTSFINTSLLPIFFEISEISLRIHDVIFAFIVLGLLLEISILGRYCWPNELNSIFIPILILLAYIGLTLLNVFYSFPKHFLLSVASFLRLGQYAFFVPLACLVLRTERDMKSFVGCFLILSLASVAIGLIQSLSGPGLLSEQSRVGALLGTNTLGLQSGFLCLFAVIQYYEKLFSGRIFAWFLLGGGILGLLLTKSVSGSLATIVVIVIYLCIHSRRGSLFILRRALIMCLGLFLFLFFLYALRSGSLHGFFEMRGGSFLHRSIMGVTGIGIFLEHPLVGVGWRASSFPEILMSPELIGWLPTIFPSAPAQYFPDITPTSVHSIYVQVLAELGLVGFFVLLVIVLYLAWRIVKIIQCLQPGTPLKALGKFFAFSLILLLIWWLGLPLYGGQIETFVLFSFLGALAALPGIRRKKIWRECYMHRVTGISHFEKDFLT